jgi:hypothetical protein
MATIHMYPGDAVAWRARRNSPVAKDDRYRFKPIFFACDRLSLAQRNPAFYRVQRFEEIR